MTTYAVISQSPDNIVDIASTITALSDHVSLSGAYGLYDILRTHTRFGDRAFSIAGQHEIWTDTERTGFKRALKIFTNWLKNDLTASGVWTNWGGGG